MRDARPLTCPAVPLALGVLLLAAVGLGASPAAAANGLGGALEGQRQDLRLQQGEARRDLEARQRELQQRQERAFQIELFDRSRPPAPPPRPLICTRVGETLFCQ